MCILIGKLSHREVFTTSVKVSDVAGTKAPHDAPYEGEGGKESTSVHDLPTLFYLERFVS